MIRAFRRLALLLCVLAGGFAAEGALAGDAPRPELPLGPYVRPGRPLVVRVHGADRVRSGSSPWALPQGERGDEFVLQTLEAGLGPLVLEIESGGAVHEVPVEARVLPRDGELRATFHDGGAPRAYPVPTRDLPTVPEAWLLFDRVDAAPDGLTGGALRALERHRGENGRWHEPLLHAPGPEAFRVAEAAARSAPVLRRDVVWASLLTASTLVLLLLLMRTSRTGRGRWAGAGVRLAWLSSPAAVFLLWSLGTGALPGAARAHAIVLEGPRNRLVLVRVEAARTLALEIRPPEGAGSVALLRFGPSDASTAAASAGARVRLELAPGEHRVLAYSLARETGVGKEPASEPARATGSLARYLASLGLVLRAGEVVEPRSALPSAAGVPVVLADAFVVQPGN